MRDGFGFRKRELCDAPMCVFLLFGHINAFVTRLFVEVPEWYVY